MSQRSYRAKFSVSGKETHLGTYGTLSKRRRRVRTTPRRAPLACARSTFQHARARSRCRRTVASGSVADASHEPRQQRVARWQLRAAHAQQPPMAVIMHLYCQSTRPCLHLQGTHSAPPVLHQLPPAQLLAAAAPPRRRYGASGRAPPNVPIIARSLCCVSTPPAARCRHHHGGQGCRQAAVRERRQLFGTVHEGAAQAAQAALALASLALPSPPPRIAVADASAARRGADARGAGGGGGRGQGRQAGPGGRRRGAHV
jgi:hypothetical protein